ncbi:hypothetical protein KQH40_00195 [bacterium]|nr:hypothetical protein [bacterium]
MNQNLKTILLVLGVVLLSILLIGAGFVFGRNYYSGAAFGPGGMMSEGQFGSNEEMPMFGGDNSGYGYGMMGGGMMGSGMMDGFNSQGFVDTNPIPIEDAKSAVEDYLSLFDEDLDISEIMIFSNHAYVQVVEAGTGIGAMELLVEPVTLAVIPEFGPNMMWNLKYGMMGGENNFGMMGSGMMGQGMMGDISNIDPATEMIVAEDEAVDLAQAYLDRVFPGFEADEHADQFYGYYTLHIESNGEIVGMLSVNGFTRQVFVHTWHGDFIEMSEH